MSAKCICASVFENRGLKKNGKNKTPTSTSGQERGIKCCAGELSAVHLLPVK